MSILGEWLKEIIFVVLIAVFIDLLLPNRSMERYVKFVVSLIILLTLISPVMKIVSSQSVDQIETALSRRVNEVEDLSLEQSTQDILNQGEKLRKEREAEALQWTAEEAARQMKDKINTSIDYEVKRVTVKLSTRVDDHVKGEQVEPQVSISAVEVVVGAAKEEDANEADPNTVAVVKPVEPVEVNIHVKRQASEQIGGKQEVVNAKEREHNDRQTVTKIEEVLLEQWGISRQIITVKFSE